MIVRAKLVKRETDDKQMTMHDHIPLGKVYIVDLDTRRVEVYQNIETGITHEKEVVNVAGEVGILPTELLEYIV